MRPKVINGSTNYGVVCLSWLCSSSTTSVDCILSFLGCCEGLTSGLARLELIIKMGRLD